MNEWMHQKVQQQRFSFYNSVRIVKMFGHIKKKIYFVRPFGFNLQSKRIHQAENIK